MYSFICEGFIVVVTIEHRTSGTTAGSATELVRSFLAGRFAPEVRDSTYFYVFVDASVWCARTCPAVCRLLSTWTISARRRSCAWCAATRSVTCTPTTPRASPFSSGPWGGCARARRTGPWRAFLSRLPITFLATPPKHGLSCPRVWTFILLAHGSCVNLTNKGQGFSVFGGWLDWPSVRCLWILPLSVTHRTRKCFPRTECDCYI